MHPFARPRRGVRATCASALLALALVSAPARSAAQILRPTEPRADYLRVLDALGKAAPGSLLVRPLTTLRAVAAVADTVDHPWRERWSSPRAFGLGGGVTVTPLDPRLRAFAVSESPYAPNEAGLWVGRGVTSAADLGFALTWAASPVHVTLVLEPTFSFTQNLDLELAPVPEGQSPYAYPWRRIDLPQQPGFGAQTSIAPGQSSLKAEVGGAVTLAVGTESLWWGPGVRNGILMSSNAAGFPHARIETSRPLDLGFARFEVQWVWGRLQRSRWSDFPEDAPDRYLTGAIATLSPDALPGLHLGLARVFYATVPEGGVPFGEYLLVFQGVRKDRFEGPQGNDRRDQMAAALMRWAHAASGFEVWMEWSRGDHAGNVRDYFLEPDHAAGLTLGLRKVTDLGGGNLLALEVESTNLQKRSTVIGRVHPTYYAHHLIGEGYTQKGHVIGAAVGPGGRSEHAGARVYAPWGLAGVFAQRRVIDNDAYYDVPDPDYCCHHVFLDLGGEGMIRWDEVELSARPRVSREFNRFFELYADHWNLGLRLEATWRPR